jgi:hypothetical protein
MSWRDFQRDLVRFPISTREERKTHYTQVVNGKKEKMYMWRDGGAIGLAKKLGNNTGKFAETICSAVLLAIPETREIGYFVAADTALQITLNQGILGSLRYIYHKINGIDGSAYN